jgi:phosphoglycolate phosphatase
VRYRLAIFDSDGTLADTLPWIRTVFNELAGEHGFRKVEPEEQERIRDLHGAELLKALGIPLWKLPRVVGGMRARMAAHAGELSTYPGISDVLRGLASAGIRLAVVSSNSRANVRRILGPANAALIDYYACGASMFGKASKLRAVLRDSAIPPADAIYIGDEIRDSEAAHQAGIAFGAVGWGQHRSETLRALNPAEFFGSVPEVLRLASD